MNTTTKTGLQAVGIVFLVPVIIGVAWLFWTGAIESHHSGVIEREQFDTLVRHKESDKVIAAIGKPDQVKTNLIGEYWIYRHKTKHRQAKKADSMVVLEFINGQVFSITYE